MHTFVPGAAEIVCSGVDEENFYPGAAPFLFRGRMRKNQMAAKGRRRLMMFVVMSSSPS